MLKRFSLMRAWTSPWVFFVARFCQHGLLFECGGDFETMAPRDNEALTRASHEKFLRQRAYITEGALASQRTLAAPV
jgi:hypothetical protein